MARKKLVVGVLAILLMTGMATMGAALPTDNVAPAEDSNETVSEKTPNAGEVASNETENASDVIADNAKSPGPPEGLPSQVPDHVDEIHDRIHQFVNGTVADGFENLGESISDIVGNESDDDTEGNGEE